MTDLKEVMASVVACSIIRDARASVHTEPTTPEAELQLILNHTTKVLAELALTRDEAAPDTERVRHQVRRRGGWSKQAQTIIYQYVSNCLQCNDQPLVHDNTNQRRAWIREHERKTAHTVVQRWEQPTAL